MPHFLKIHSVAEGSRDRLVDALREDGVAATAEKYVGTFRLLPSPDASGTFTVVLNPEYAALRDSDRVAIEIGPVTAANVTVHGQ